MNLLNLRVSLCNKKVQRPLYLIYHKAYKKKHSVNLIFSVYLGVKPSATHQISNIKCNALFISITTKHIKNTLCASHSLCASRCKTKCNALFISFTTKHIKKTLCESHSLCVSRCKTKCNVLIISITTKHLKTLRVSLCKKVQRYTKALTPNS